MKDGEDSRPPGPLVGVAGGLEFPSIVVEAVFPPFTRLSPDLARSVLWGDGSAVEILSVNGHAIMLLGPGGRGAYLSLYWAAAPLDPGARDEWALVVERVTRVLPEMEIAAGGRASYGVPLEGWALARYGPVDDAYALTRLVGLARSIAGLKPYTGPPPGGALPLPPSGADLDNALFGPTGAVVLLDWLDLGEEMLPELALNGLYYEVMGTVDAHDIVEYGGSPSERTVREAYRRLVELGVLKRCGRGPRTRYYVDVRHEIAVSGLFSIAPGHKLPCALLPLIEGVDPRLWRVFPGPYEVCREAAARLSRLAIRYGGPPC